MSVNLIIYHAKRMRLIVIAGLRGSTIFFHIILNGTTIEKSD
jgi:hypothetical protein